MPAAPPPAPPSAKPKSCDSAAPVAAATCTPLLVGEIERGLRLGALRRHAAGDHAGYAGQQCPGAAGHAAGIGVLEHHVGRQEIVGLGELAETPFAGDVLLLLDARQRLPPIDDLEAIGLRHHEPQQRHG